MSDGVEEEENTRDMGDNGDEEGGYGFSRYGVSVECRRRIEQ